MKISLILSTYERPHALRAVLGSIERQTRQPDEILIGDDGSGLETAAVIEAAVGRGLNIRRCWQPHDGYRLGRMRNMCAAAAAGEYLVIIDGDILLHAEYLADHATAARPGFFVQGSRALLDAAATEEAISRDAYWPSFFASGINNRKNLIRSRTLSRLFSKESDGLKGIRTCNFALWRNDFARVNGFNEDFVGWGREDSEFVNRLLNAGVRRFNLRFAGLGCHLYHPPQSRVNLERNDALLAESQKQGASSCARGLNLHLSGENGKES